MVLIEIPLLDNVFSFFSCTRKGPSLSTNRQADAPLSKQAIPHRIYLIDRPFLGSRHAFVSRPNTRVRQPPARPKYRQQQSLLSRVVIQHRFVILVPTSAVVSFFLHLAHPIFLGKDWFRYRASVFGAGCVSNTDGGGAVFHSRRWRGGGN